MSGATSRETVGRTVLGMYGPGDSVRVITREVVRVQHGSGVRWLVRTTTACRGDVTNTALRFKRRGDAEQHVDDWVRACCEWRHQGVHSPLVEVAS